jgi:hypothetical protein
MTVSAGTFQIGTGIVGTTYGPALSFRPAAVFLRWSGKNQTGNDTGMTNHNEASGEGFILENGKRGCLSKYGQDAADPYNCGAGLWNTEAVVRMTGSGSTGGRADFDSMTDTGFLLVIDEVFGAEITVQYIAISGFEFNTIEFTEPGAAGAQSYSGAGFRPTFAKFFGLNVAAYDTMVADLAWCIGAASDSAADRQAVFAFTEDSGAGTSANTRNYRRHGECLALMPLAGNPDLRASLTGFADDGFQLNYTERAGSRKFIAVVASGRWYVFPMQFHLDTTPWTESGMTWAPQGLMLYASTGNSIAGQANDAESVADTSINRSETLVIGYGTGPTERFAMMTDSGAGGTGLNIAGSLHRRDVIWLGHNNIAADAWADWTDAGDINSAFAADSIEFVLDIDDPDRTGQAWMYCIAIGPPIIELRARLVKYRHNTYESRAAGRTLIGDILGRKVPNHDVKPDNFLFEGGPLFPTPRKYASLIENPATFYIESVQATEERVKIETNREALIQTLFRRLSG